MFPPALSPAVCDLEQISSSLTLFSPPLGVEQHRGMKAQTWVWEDVGLIWL